MNREYNIFLRIARWLRRFRHRCGYGVHSPFAFQFITGVVYCSDPYYAYAALSQPLEPSVSRLDDYDPQSGLTARDLRLLFRIANWAEPTALHLLGASSAVEAHICAARRQATVHHHAPTHGKSSVNNKKTENEKTSTATTPSAETVLVYADSPALLPPQLEAAAIIVRGIHSSTDAHARWQQLKAAPQSTLTFDLGRFGVVIHHPKITPQHYIVNYF